MKVVILAGGYGTRLSEETDLKPKPMVEIGEKPILWHIMKLYSFYGYNDFIICCGYKGYVIKEYFSKYYLYMSDVTFEMSDNNRMIIHNNIAEPWKVTLVDTGLNTMTGSRLKRVEKYLDDTFMLTYGDGVSNVNINELVSFHNSHGKLATMTAVNPDGRFGAAEIDENGCITSFSEKPQDKNAWINGGFFVLEPSVLDYIDDLNDCIFERATLRTLAEKNQLIAFRHNGFWQPMDNLREKKLLQNLWDTNAAPWKVWEN